MYVLLFRHNIVALATYITMPKKLNRKGSYYKNTAFKTNMYLHPVELLISVVWYVCMYVGGLVHRYAIIKGI